MGFLQLPEFACPHFKHRMRFQGFLACIPPQLNFQLSLTVRSLHTTKHALTKYSDLKHDIKVLGVLLDFPLVEDMKERKDF